MEGIRSVPTIEITLSMQCARQTTQMVLSTIARPLSILYPVDLRLFTQGDSYNGVFLQHFDFSSGPSIPAAFSSAILRSCTLVPDCGVAFSTHTFRGIIIDEIEHLGFTATSATRSLSSVTKRNNHVHIEEQQYIENFERSSTRITGDNNETIRGWSLIRQD